MDRQPASSAAAAVVDCAAYVDGVRLPGTHTPESALGEVRRRGSGFVWLGLFAPTFEQMTAVAQTYGLHELVAEDSVHAHQRSKLEQYDGSSGSNISEMKAACDRTSCRGRPGRSRSTPKSRDSFWCPQEEREGEQCGENRADQTHPSASVFVG